MRLRVFLMKRAIHTVITLLVVLVLLFVIFRIMPGDPSRFFIQPGQSPEVRKELEVSFGFSKYEPMPGHGYESSIEVPVEGTYMINITVNDTKGNEEVFYASFTREKVFSIRAPITILNITVGPKELWNITVGDEVIISAVVKSPNPNPVVWAVLAHGNETIENITFSRVMPDEFIYRGRTIPENVGVYLVQIHALDISGASATAPSGFAVNKDLEDLKPFELVEDRIQVNPDPIWLDRAHLSINVTSSEGDINKVRASVTSPNWYIKEYTLYRPLRVVPRSILEQFWVYFTGMLTFDFGRSFFTRTPVWTEISRRVGPTLLLFGSAVIIAYLFGILIGAVMAWRRGSKMELSSIVISLFFYSMPVFWFGLILVWFFAFKMGWFPLGGMGGFDPSTGKLYVGFAYLGDVLWHMTLPLANLVILSLAGTVLLMRNSMLEVLGEDYITTAKAKGLKERTVMYKHAARNALLPVVTALAISIGGVISGGVLTETIFSWPGMGYYLVTATLQQDYPAVQGAFYLLAIMTILANMVADMLYAYLDPRVRL